MAWSKGRRGLVGGCGVGDVGYYFWGDGELEVAGFGLEDRRREGWFWEVGDGRWGCVGGAVFLGEGADGEEE